MLNDLNIRMIRMSIRTLNALSYNNIETVADMMNLTDADMAVMKNVGKRIIEEIKYFQSELEAHMDVPPAEVKPVQNIHVDLVVRFEDKSAVNSNG